ncbi:MAG: hypothetical protein U0326_40700 [Polyangiales bacterium]
MSRPCIALMLAFLGCARAAETPPTNDATSDANDAASVDDLAATDAPLDTPVFDASTDVTASDARADVTAPDVTATDVTATDVTATDVTATDARADVTAPTDVAVGCDPRLPTGWPSGFAPWAGNPVLVASRSASIQGEDNVYAPEIQRVSGARVMWYGAQGGDGHDRIFVAVARDGGEWRKWPSESAPSPALDRGTSNHVNDPSVVSVGGRWRMYYTDAPTAENDRIWLAESSSLTGFAKVREVLGVGPAGSWDAEKVGRPAVLYDGGVYRMWYDGTASGQRHVGLATSTDGVNFVRHPANPLFRNAGAVDVKHLGGAYVMLREGGDGTYWATSPDGVCWVDRGRLFARSGAAYDAFGQVTPFLEVDGDTALAVWFGGASVSSWNRNRIAAAFATGSAAPTAWGCTACVPWGDSCTAACQRASGGRAGVCAAPGSAVEGRCCACSDDGCGRCTTATDCHAACVAAGAVSGWCGSPGSTDPSRCCACVR